MTVAATDAWLVRWTLAGAPRVLPWDMLVTIPGCVLDTSQRLLWCQVWDTDRAVRLWRVGGYYAELMQRATVLSHCALYRRIKAPAPVTHGDDDEPGCAWWAAPRIKLIRPILCQLRELLDPEICAEGLKHV